MNLDLNDLQPKESTLILGGKPYVLGKFTLRAQVWTHNRFGKDHIEGIFKNGRLGDISEIAYFLLKDKSWVPTLEAFQDLVETQLDKKNLIQALLDTVGLSQPVIEKLAKESPTGNGESPNLQIGAQSSTNLQPNTDGQLNAS